MSDTFGDRVRRQRCLRGETLPQFADRVGVHLRTVSSWESGERLPASRIMTSLCLSLGVTEHYLRHGHEEPDPMQVVEDLKAAIRRAILNKQVSRYDLLRLVA